MKTKKLLSVFLSMAILLSLFVVPASAETAAPTDNWHTHAADSFESGTGTEDDPYVIATEAQLALLSVNVANGTAYTGAWFKLMNDLDLSAHRWNPIGQHSLKDDGTEYGDFTLNPFSGNFDGNGKTISGIYVDEATDGFSGGLFGCIINYQANDGNDEMMIRNLTIKDAVIYGKEAGLIQGYSGILSSYVSAGIDKAITIENVHVSGSLNITCVSGNYAVGGMVGCADNITFTDCTVDNIYQYAATNSGGFVGIDDNCTYTDCSASGTVYGSWCMGGFVGYTTLQNSTDSSTYSTFTNCVADVNVIANNWKVGGFVGISVGGKFEKCVAYGDVYNETTDWDPYVAGFAGYLDPYYGGDTTLGLYPSTLKNCYFAGTIESACTVAKPSGLVAFVGTGSTITDCAYDGEKNSGIVGYADEESTTALSTVETGSQICLNVLGGHTMEDKTCTKCGYVEKEALNVSFFVSVKITEETADWTPNLTAFDTTGVHFNTKGLNSRDTEINGDYTVEWYDKFDNILDEAPTDAGSYTIKIVLGETAGASYTLEQDTLTYTINPLDLSTAIIGLEWPGKQPTYNGKQQLPAAPDAAVKNSSYTLPNDSYTIKPVDGKNCTDAGLAYCLIEGNGENVVGQIEKSYYINKVNYDLPSAEKRVYIYDGTAKETDYSNVVPPENFKSVEPLSWHLADKSKALSEAPSNVGSYMVYVKYTPKDTVNYLTKHRHEYYDIVAASLENAVIEVDSNADLTYTGNEITPSVTVTMNGKTLAKDTDYTVTYSDNIYAGTSVVTVTGIGNYKDSKTANFTINPVEVEKPVADTTVFTYNGNEQTYAVAENTLYSVTGNKRTDAGSHTVTVALNNKTNYEWADGTTDDVTFTFSIAKKDITSAEITLGDSLTYNGEEQTQTFYVAQVDGLDITYDVSGNKATDVKTDGNYILTITGNGNFEGTATAEWNIAKKTINTAISLTAPVANAAPQTTIDTDEYTATVVWSPEVTDKFTYSTAYTATITITPKANYTVTGISENSYTVDGAETAANEADSETVTVTYAETGRRPSSGGGGSSTTTTTTKNEDGSTTRTTTNRNTGTTTEVTTNTDGSTSTVETKKDGTVTTTEKDKDGNTTTTVEKPDGTSTTTEKNKDGSEKVTEKEADGTTTTTEKDSEGNKTVTTEKPDGSTTTEETKKDGTKVTTETTADGETTAEIEAMSETEVFIPVANAEDVTMLTITDEDGNVTEITDIKVVGGGVAVSVSGNASVAVSKEAKKTFVDVHPVNHWATADIDYAFINGLMTGVSETHFAPDSTLTRAMLVTVLYRNEGEPATNRSIPFADIDMGAYYANAVIWAQQNGIVKGISETEFAPNDNITREQIAAIMHRYAQYKGYDVSVGENTNILSYTDFDSISEYAIASMQYAVGSGLMKGKSTSTLNPLDTATRAEIAAILHRFIEANK